MACFSLLIESRAIRRSPGGCLGDAASDVPRDGRAGPSPLAARSGDGGGWRVVPQVSLLEEERPAQSAAPGEGERLSAAVRGRGGEPGPAGQGRGGREGRRAAIRSGAVQAARRCDTGPPWPGKSCGSGPRVASRGSAE